MIFRHRTLRVRVQRFATLLGTSLLAGATLPLAAQTPSVVPIPFATTIAGTPAGLSSANPPTACPSTSQIPNNLNQNLGDGCLPTQPQVVLATVYGSFTDAEGNIYITENGTNNDIRVIYKGGAALKQLLIASYAGLATNPAVASNALLQNFTPIPGHIYTLAGSITGTLSIKNGTKYACNAQTTGPTGLDSAGDGCPGSQAYIKPRGLAVDANGNVFFVSTGGGNLVKVMYAGGAQVANLITLENPGVTPQVGAVYKLSGQSTAGYSGDNGLASAAALIVVRDIVVDSNGNLYISDGNSTSSSGNNIRKIDGSTGIITTYAGGLGCSEPLAANTYCPAGDVGDTKAATSATLNGPYTLFLDRFNNLYISEYSGNRLRVVASNTSSIPGISSAKAGNIYTFAGGGASSADGTLASLLALGSVQVAGVDPAGNIYVEDSTAKVIWRFDASTGIGYVIAGHKSGSTPAAGAFCSGTAGPQSQDNFGDGCPATMAAMSDIGRISFDGQGNMYVGENGNAVVRELSYNTQFPSTNVGVTTTQSLAYKALAAATISSDSFTVQGQGTSEFSDAGTGTCNALSGLTAAQVCTFDVNFTPAHSGLRPGTYQLSGSTSTLVSQVLSGVGVASDLAVDPGTQTSAGTNLQASGVVTDLFGNIYIADQVSNSVLKGTTTSTTLTPLVTNLNKPAGLALDSAGNLYIADSGNNRVLETTSSGTTVGTVGAGLTAPSGVAVDQYGNVFIADTGNNRVVEIAPNGVQSTVALTGLSAPTQLTFDANGDLFVVDSGNARIVELPVNNSQIALSLPSGVTPTAVAADAAGTVYVTDSTNLQVLAFAPGSTDGDTLVTGLKTPAALAVDQDGNLYVADTGLTSVLYDRRSLGNITFPITNVNQSSESSINLLNVGNAALDFPTTTLFAVTGAPEITLAPSTTNGCSSGVNYAPGTGCNFTATFLPTVPGNAAANATFNTNAVNNAAAQISGGGLLLVSTTTGLAVTSPTGTISYGQVVTLTATVTPASNAGTPSGTVTFTVNGKAQTPQPYGNGTVTLTLNPAVGTYAISVAYSGDGNYASSSASTNFTVALAPTTTALTVAPQSSNGTVSLVFTATVNSSTATGETGTVSFYAGTQLLGTVNLSGSRTATYTTATLSFATNTFTASYSGNANFASSTSSAQTPASDFAIAASITTASIPQGGDVNIGFVIASLYNSTGTITPTCSGLPANTVCRFQPTTISLSGVTNVQLLVDTNVDSNIAQNTSPFGLRTVFYASLLPLTLLLAGGRSRKLRSLGLALLVSLCVFLPMNGCSSGSSSATNNQGKVTPVGTSAITVTFTGAGSLASHTAPLNLTVIQNNTSF